MKVCNRCKETKPLDEFQKRARNPDGYAYMCKPCKRAYDNEHYRNNPGRRTYIRKNSDKRVLAAKTMIMDYLSTHPCVDCGEKDLVVLEFDHRENKEHSVSKLIHAGMMEKLMDEMKKCDIRCANCHRRKTASDFGSYRIVGQ